MPIWEVLAFVLLLTPVIYHQNHETTCCHLPLCFKYFDFQSLFLAEASRDFRSQIHFAYRYQKRNRF